nr:heterogeneous nuclear ribonucleoprotein C-like 2 [Cherax quadricarinatus]
MSKVGNQTNSQDPQAVNSRTFVGNLNTFQCTKTDVERMFQRYGRIAGRNGSKGAAGGIIDPTDGVLALGSPPPVQQATEEC